MHIKRAELNITEEQLLELPKGTVTENGVRKRNINVGILYIESWLMGVGAAALYNLMEDAVPQLKSQEHNYGFGYIKKLLLKMEKM